MPVIERVLQSFAPALRAESRQVAGRVESLALQAARHAGDVFERGAAAAVRAEAPGAAAIERDLKATLESSLKLRFDNWLGQFFGKSRHWQDLAVREVTPAAGGRLEFLAGGRVVSHHPDYDAIREHILVGTFDPKRGTVTSVQRHPVPIWLELKDLSNEKLRQIFQEKWD